MRVTESTESQALSGNWATLLLPIDEHDEVDFGRLAEEIDILIAANVDGIYSNGTAGEFHNQAESEFDAIQQIFAEKCTAAEMPFVIGACQPDPKIQLERVRRSAEQNPAAIQVILPEWWPVTNEEAIRYLQAVAGLTRSISIVLYNPPHAKRVLAPKDLAVVVAEVPQVSAIKLADGDEQWYAEAQEHLAGTALFVPGHHLATGMRNGVAAGAFSNVACLSPTGAQRWTDMMATDMDTALDIERRLIHFMDEHIVPFRTNHGYSNGALDKLLAAIGNWAPLGTRLRTPYSWIPESEAERLRPIAHDLLPEIMTR